MLLKEPNSTHIVPSRNIFHAKGPCIDLIIVMILPDNTLSTVVAKLVTDKPLTSQYTLCTTLPQILFNTLDCRYIFAIRYYKSARK